MSVGYQNGGKNQRPAAQGADADWDALKNDVGEIAGAAVERGRHFMDAAREQATDYVDHRKDAVADSVAELATSLRESTRSFEDRPNIRAFVDSAAEGLEQLAGSIRERSFADIFNDVEDVVRRRPAVVAAVTVAVGFLTARFIKASAAGLRYDYRDVEQRAERDQRQADRRDSRAPARG
jgi:ElaB/YqjD/DUF883 family membrane-anchored ribosome-binding protein